MNLQVRIVEGPLKNTEPWNVPGAGAIVSFSGIVRPFEHDRAIAGLLYEAYQPMAERQITAIAEQTIQTHKLLAMRVVHSIGWVTVGEVSLRLDIAAPHRGPALDAMKEFIDQLKHDVPIWKEPR